MSRDRDGNEYLDVSMDERVVEALGRGSDPDGDPIAKSLQRIADALEAIVGGRVAAPLEHRCFAVKKVSEQNGIVEYICGRHDGHLPPHVDLDAKRSWYPETK